MMKTLAFFLALISSFGFSQNRKLIDSLKYEITIAIALEYGLKGSSGFEKLKDTLGFMENYQRRGWR